MPSLTLLWAASIQAPAVAYPGLPHTISGSPYFVGTFDTSKTLILYDFLNESPNYALEKLEIFGGIWGNF